MTTAAASILFFCLITVALAHLLWALGAPWPVRDPKLLAATVVGKDGVDRVQRLRMLLVAVFALVASAIGTALADLPSGGLALTLGGLALATIFGVRGALGYTASWRERHPREPFAALDRKFYSPLCLVVAGCFLVLCAMRLL